MPELHASAHPDDFLDPPTELLIGQCPHDLDIRITIEGFGRKLALIIMAIELRVVPPPQLNVKLLTI